MLVVRRVLNNNAVLVEDDAGAESIVLGKAIGYSKRPGDDVDEAQVTQTFVPDVTLPIERLAAFLSDINIEVVRVAREIVDLAHQRLGVRVTQALLLPIADHLSFAITRVRDGITMEYPLRWEVTQLYPQEVAIGAEGVALTARRLGVELPAEEAIPLALHLVNAQFAMEGLNKTIRMTERISQVIKVVQSGTGVSIDPDSMSAARFVTHLRYLFVRMQQHKQITDSPVLLVSAIKESHPREYVTASRVRFLLEVEGNHLTEDEVLYLTLHVARLAADSRG